MANKNIEEGGKLPAWLRDKFSTVNFMLIFASSILYRFWNKRFWAKLARPNRFNRHSENGLKTANVLLLFLLLLFLALVLGKHDFILSYLNLVWSQITSFGISDLVRLSFQLEMASIILLSILKIVLWVVLTLGVWGIFIWLTGSGRETIVLPFLNETGIHNYGGRSISDSLISELHRIHNIHCNSLKQDFGVPDEPGNFPELAPYHPGNFPELTPYHESLESHLLQVGSIGLGESQLSIGRFIAVIRKLWPFGHPGRTISGSVHNYGNLIRIVARIEDREVRAWDVTREIVDINIFPELVHELSFKVAIHLEPSISVRSWQAFKFFTEAIAEYSRYQRTNDNESLVISFYKCKEALKYEKYYQKPVNLLSRIGRSFFVDRSLGQKRFTLAKEAFNLVISTDEDSYSQEVVYAYNGLGLVHTAQRNYQEATHAYLIAITKDPGCPHIYNGLARLYYHKLDFKHALSNFKHAVLLDPNFFLAHYNLAIVYSYQWSPDLQMADTHSKYALHIATSRDSSQYRRFIDKIHSIRGWLSLLEGNYDNSIQESKEAIYLKPNGYIPHGNLGIAYFRKYIIFGNHSDLLESKSYFEKACSLSEDEQDWGDQLSYIFYRAISFLSTSECDRVSGYTQSWRV